MGAMVRFLVGLAVVVVGLFAGVTAQASAMDIEAEFRPEARRLAVAASVSLEPIGAAGRVLSLTAKAKDLRVLADLKPVRPEVAGDLVRVRLPRGAKILTLSYVLLLDPAPDKLPASMDNPGALASDAAAGPDWAMLMPGSFWHPEFEDGDNAYRLRLTAPAGIAAVTQGKLAETNSQPDKTVTVWDVARPMGRLGLCLARYRLGENREGSVPVQTFFLESSERFAQVYLEASARHLAFYSKLHGPYAFEKFAVAENPLPTGYGFPSYTLLGSQVIALPFIPAVSLRHEIAHSWWGNGVLVDHAGGNWCEGLTTYVADYLGQEEQSPQAARAYRLKTLRAFAALAAERGELTLARFAERVSPASQAVGYGKAMFVFHMLRTFVGDDHFWQGLRTLYAQRLGKRTSWEDIRQVFAGMPGFDERTSRVFFRQWLTRPGGPVLKLEAATSRPNPVGGYTVQAKVLQAGSPYLLKLALAVETDQGNADTQFILDGPARTVSLDVPGKPLKATLDPGADCFRLLDASEVPPTVNTVKAARGLTVIVAESAPKALRDALPGLLAGLGQESARVLPESSPQAKALVARPGQAMLVAGSTRLTLPGAKDPLAGEAGADLDTGFAVAARPGGFTAVFDCRPEADARAVAEAAAKITHYGTFGRIGFKGGRNQLKEVPEPPASKLEWILSNESGEKPIFLKKGLFPGSLVTKKTLQIAPYHSQ
jgi:hypothetical protein